MSWALSCLSFKEHYEIDLVTDDFGEALLIQQLKLPYTRVNKGLNGLSYHHDLWAVGKIIAYGMQSDPFLHVDNDIFLNKPFDNDLLKAPLIAQNLEIDYQYHKDLISTVNENFCHLPSVLNDDSGFLYFSNAGVLGGNDFEFYKEYCALALKVLDENKQSILKMKNRGLINNYIEQYIFYKLSELQGKDITYVFDEISQGFHELVNFHEPNDSIVYRHVVSRFKQNKDFGNYVEDQLRSLYPEYYLNLLKTLT